MLKNRLTATERPLSQRCPTGDNPVVCDAMPGGFMPTPSRTVGVRSRAVPVDAGVHGRPTPPPAAEAEGRRPVVAVHTMWAGWTPRADARLQRALDLPVGAAR